MIPSGLFFPTNTLFSFWDVIRVQHWISFHISSVSSGLKQCFTPFLFFLDFDNSKEYWWGILKNIPDMGLPNDSLTLNWDCRFSVWFYHRSEAFLMTSYQGEWYPHYITGEDHLYLLPKAELAKFLYSKLECWIWNAVNNNYFYIFSIFQSLHFMFIRWIPIILKVQYQKSN